MPVKLLTSGGGGVNLVPSGSIASDQTMYLPTSGTSGGTVLCTDSTGGTANGVLYLNGSKQVTSGSGLVFDSSGNLGLGVTPSAWSQGRAFEILNKGYGLWNGSGAPASTYMLANAYFNSSFKYAETGQASFYCQYLGQHIWSTAGSGTAGNPITFTQAMTLDSSGNLLVGTTSAITSGITVFGSGGGSLSGTYNSRNTTMTSGRSWNFGASQGEGFVVYGNNNGSFVSGVSLSWGGNSWASQSDERTKEIIKPISGALEGLMLLRTVIGRYKTDDENRRRPFLIAQDLQVSFPEVVTEQDDEQKTLGIEYSNMIPFLTAAIQEAVAKIESQAQTIESLTQRIEALEYTKQGE